MLELYKERMPNHIAFIIDGNGRWAKIRGKERTEGHKAGIEAVKKTIEAAKELDIKIVSFFVFSTENWKRPKAEVDAIMKMLKDFIKSNKSKYEKENIKLTAMGNIEALDKDISKELYDIIEKTKFNTGLNVNICINYGGRSEIINAVNNIIKDKIENVDEDTFKKYLYSSSITDPDLIIRTSGEYRLSNFMLWQCAYAELYFTKIYWPDFGREELIEAIYDYQNRERRFGKV